MKKSTFTKFFAAAALLLIVTSCAKYDEGSNFSVFTAKARVVNSWTMSSSMYSNNGNSTTNTGFSEVVATFSKDGSYSYAGKLYGFSFNEAGTWSFGDDKTTLILVEDDGSTEIWNIIKLKNKEMKVSYEDGGTYTFEFTGA